MPRRKKSPLSGCAVIFILLVAGFGFMVGGVSQLPNKPQPLIAQATQEDDNEGEDDNKWDFYKEDQQLAEARPKSQTTTETRPEPNAGSSSVSAYRPTTNSRSEAAKKAWETRRERYGHSGRRK